jgi:hypothetical protein
MNVGLEYIALAVIVLLTAFGGLYLSTTPALETLFGHHPLGGYLIGFLSGLFIDIFLLGTLFLFLEINNNLIEIKVLLKNNVQK